MFDEVDMSQYPEKRKEMMGQIPSDYATVESPIIFDNSEESLDFVGLYDEFFNAREQDKIFQFLNLPPPDGSREHILWKKENAPEPVQETESEEPVAENIDNVEENMEETRDDAGDDAGDYEFPGEAKPEDDAAEDDAEE
ncbi:unnamed protein product [Oikopleura dioica]|uniref:Uncharacterized protein n=1 Tax=Oikopleura dioica TaxID=34765 RepID=E4X414_OIKDI|nr:unnamed protein product [Oikopleura dioica]CBY36776.1 unnamed protein product [Oikopleura dioica]